MIAKQTPDSRSEDSSKNLIDPFNRRIEYVRLSVTDKCNLRCFYCLPKAFKAFEQPEHWLTFDEIERVITPSASKSLLGWIGSVVGGTAAFFLLDSETRDLLSRWP